MKNESHLTGEHWMWRLQDSVEKVRGERHSVFIHSELFGEGLSFILSFFKKYETMNIHTKFSFLAQHCTSFHAVSTKMMTYPCVWIDVFISYSKNNEYHSHSYFHRLQPNWKKCSKDVPKKKKQLIKILVKTSKMWSELYTKVELQGWYHF